MSVRSAVYRPEPVTFSSPSGRTKLSARSSTAVTGLSNHAGPARGRALQSSAVTRSYKLVWFVPASHLRATRDAVFVAGAGWIGEYSRCSWATLGEGSFFGGEGTQPALGEAGRDETVAEYRVETVVPPGKLTAVVEALRRAHPYEEPAFDVYERIEV